MLTVRQENFISFDETGKKSIVTAQIDVDTADELPEVDGIPGRILHQGSKALVIREGWTAVLGSDGRWYDISGKKTAPVEVVECITASGETTVAKVIQEEEEND